MLVAASQSAWGAARCGPVGAELCVCGCVCGSGSVARSPGAPGLTPPRDADCKVFRNPTLLLSCPHLVSGPSELRAASGVCVRG